MYTPLRSRHQALTVGGVLLLTLCGGPLALDARAAESGAASAAALTVLRTDALPAPDRTGSRPLETLLQERVSVRAFASDTLTAAEVGQLLWAAGGQTHAGERFTHRTVPSAGALYPLEIYVVASSGVGRYSVADHSIEWHQEVDRRAGLSAAAYGQRCFKDVPLIVVIAADPSRTTVKYGIRGERYATMEAGFACQNLLLEAVARGLGAVAVGAFDDDHVRNVVGLPAGELPLLLVPVGHPAPAAR